MGDGRDDMVSFAIIIPDCDESALLHLRPWLSGSNQRLSLHIKLMNRLHITVQFLNAGYI